MGKKVAAGNKKAQKSKLKSILAQPKPIKCPSLTKAEMMDVGNFLSSALKESGQQTNAFIKTSNISLGLASTLRAINKCECSCVFISLSLKPHHLISLIARNLGIKDETVPIFAQSDLDIITDQVFGIRALAMALPKELGPLSNHFKEWINTHKKLAKVKKITKITKPLKTQAKKRSIKMLEPKMQTNSELNKQQILLEPEAKRRKLISDNDFISFSSVNMNTKVDAMELQEETAQLSNVLKKLTATAEEKIKTSPRNTSKDLVCESTKPMKEMRNSVKRSRDSSDSDDFLDKYEPCKIIKVKSKPKHKTKKNKKR